MHTPNVLWVSLESVRADHSSVDGYGRDTMPNIRSESERSVATRFQATVSQSMWTPASTASMLTGTYLSTHTVGQDGMAQRKLPSAIESLPERLVEAGYETALFSPNPYIGPATGLDRGFRNVYDLRSGKKEFVPKGRDAIDEWICALRRIVETRDLRWNRLRNDIIHNPTCVLPRRFRRWLSRTRQPDRPFFGYVHVDAPHHPYLPIAKYRDEFSDGTELDSDDAYDLVKQIYDGSEAIRRRMAQGLSLDESEWEAIKAMYDAEIRLADEVTETLIRAARTMSERRLIVVVTADHGELFGEYGLIGHNLVLHDGVIRVPLLVSGIEDTIAGPDTITQHIDVTYTLANLAGVSTDGLEGRDLRDPERPFGISQRGIAHLDSYTEHDPSFEGVGFGREPITAVRTAEYKLLVTENGYTLYELPDEQYDVSDRRPEVVTRLAGFVERADIEWNDMEAGEAVHYDEETANRLRALGYLTDSTSEEKQ